MKRRRWFDRRFELGLPREAFRDILERLFDLEALWADRLDWRRWDPPT